MRSFFLLAFAVALATALSAQTSTFVKKLGASKRCEIAFSLCAAFDGNVYIAGTRVIIVVRAGALSENLFSDYPYAVHHCG